MSDPGEGERELVLERRVLSLAHQLAELINAERPEEREILREIAVNALRDEVFVPQAEPTGAAWASQTFNPFGIAIPMVLTGSLLIFLFPPVGVALFGVAGLMVVWGIIVTLLVRS